MSAVTPTNATVTAKGVVIFEYDGVIRAQLGSEIAAAVITGTITETQIADNAISTPKLQAGSVVTAKLAAAAVLAGNIAAEAVEAAKVKAGAITTVKLAAEAVEASKVKAGAITTVKLAASAVTAEKIAVSELSAISANVGTVTAGVIQGPTIRTGTVGARVQLASSGLQAFNAGGEEVLNFSTATGNLFIKGELKAGSIVPATTITGLLTSAQIAELEASKITGTITETQVGAEAISTPKLKAGAVVTAKLAAAAVTAEKIAVAELSAISANVGSITAGSITGVKISGAEIFISEHEGVTTFPSENKYRLSWVDPEGKAHSSIWAGFNATNSALQVVANRSNNRTTGTAELVGVGSGENNAAGVKVTSSGTLTSSVSIYANTLSAESASKQLLSQDGKSDFLQLIATAKKRFNSGFAEGSYAGATYLLDFTITHGLGAVPGSLNVTVDSSPNGGALFNHTTTILEKTSTKFKVRTQIADKFEPAVGTKLGLFWEATV